jgi:hypothetical protein
MPDRRRAALIAPGAVPLSMAAVFAVLRRVPAPRAAYNVGFGIYWAGWCLAFPTATASAWKAGGVRPGLLPHVLTDACGVTAARFRLGR